EPSCPILASLAPTVMPGASAGTRKTAIPGPDSDGGCVRANTTNNPASVALVMNCLVPSITQPSPSGSAAVRRLAGFDPAPGSVSANDATFSAEARPGSDLAFCSSGRKPTSACPATRLLVPTIDRSDSDV